MPSGENLIIISYVHESELISARDDPHDVLSHLATTLLSDNVSFDVGGPSLVTTSL
jgi:hypothetical protein